MKSFKEFLNEADEVANKIVQFKRKLAGATDPAEQERLRKAIADAQKSSQKPPVQPAKTAPQIPTKATAGTRAGGPNATISGQPVSRPGQVKPSNRLAKLAKGAGTYGLKIGAYTAADLAADAAISKIKNPNTRDTTQKLKDFAVFAATPVFSGTLGIDGSSAPMGKRDAGPYRIQKRIDTDPESGYDKFLATGKNKKGYTYNDPKAEKIMAYRRDRIGSKKLEDKPFRVGAAKLGGQIVPVEYGSVAGEKKVGPKLDPKAPGPKRLF